MSPPASLLAQLVPWLALIAGFSPALVQFVRDEAATAPPSTLVAPALIALSLWRGSVHPEPPRRAGALLLALGLLLELIGIALRIWTVEWLGFPIGVLGLSLWLGMPSWHIAVLAFGLVPIPESIRIAHTPAAEGALLSGACAAWRALGVAFSCTGPVARLGDRHLELGPDDVGWTLAPLLAQLGWFLALSRGARTVAAASTALAFVAATAVIQPSAVFLALGVFAAGWGHPARAWLSHGPWLGSVVGAVLWSLLCVPRSVRRG